MSTTIAHTDFIKTLLVIPELDVLVTGSSDKDLRIWDLSTLDSFDFSSLASSATASSSSTTTNELSDAPVESKKTGSGGAAPPAAVSQNPLPLLTSLKSHTRPIERLAYFLISTNSTEGSNANKTGKFGLVSTDSMGVLKIWELGRRIAEDGKISMQGAEKCSVRYHELAIYDLVVSAENGEIWTGAFSSLSSKSVTS